MAWGLAPKIAMVGATGVALYSAAGFFAAPAGIRLLIIDEFDKRFDRDVKIGGVSLNPFTLALEIHDLHIPDADGADAASFEKLSVKMSASSAWRGGLAFDEVSVMGPVLRLERRTDGTINLSDFAVKDDKSGGLPKMWVEKLVVSGGRLDYADLARPEPLKKSIGDIAFAVSELSVADNAIPFSLRAEAAGGETIAWDGVVNLDPFSSEGTFDLKALNLVKLADWAGGLPTVNMLSGNADLQGKYALTLEGVEPQLDVTVAKAQARDVVMSPHRVEGRWVRAKTLDLADVHVDLAARSVEIGSADIKAPYVFLAREKDGEINLMRLAPPAPAAEMEATAAADLPWSLSAAKVRVSEGYVDVLDRSTGTPAGYALSNLAVSADGLAFPSKAPATIDASAVVNRTGSVSAQGTIAIDRGSGELAIKASGIELKNLQPLVADIADVQIASGVLAADGRAVFSETAANFRGQASIEAMRATDMAGTQELMRWKKLSAAGIDLHPTPFSLRIANARVEDPYARVVIEPDAGINLAQAFHGEQGSQAPAEEMGPVSIGVVEVTNGSLDFTDLSIKPSVQVSLQELSGQIGGLSSDPAARADVKLVGMVDRFSPASVTGRVNYLGEDPYADLQLALGKVQMATLSPYAGRFAGYELRRGTLDAELRYLIDDRKLDADHHVIINNLLLGEKVESPDAVDLPVPLAVALLTDANGVIDIEIPVEGSLDDPEFKLDAVVWKGVGNVLAGAVASPFNILGALVGGGREFEYVVFAPGEAKPNAAALENLAALRTALIERPSIGIEAPITFDPERDRGALRDAKFDALFAAALASPAKAGAKPAAKSDPATAERMARAAALEQVYAGLFGAAPSVPAQADNALVDPIDYRISWLREQAIGRIEVTDADLEALGQARAAAVQEALLVGGQIDAGRVFIVRQPETQRKDAPAQQVQMKLAVTS
jgi:hypothetical protein